MFSFAQQPRDQTEISTQARWANVEAEYCRVKQVMELSDPQPVALPSRNEMIAEFEEFMLRILQSINLPETEGKSDPLLPSRYLEEKEFLKRTGPKNLAAFFKAAEIIFRALEEDVHITKRDLYYSGTAWFRKAIVSDTIIERLASMFRVPRNCLQVVAAERGSAIGNLRYLMDGHAVDLMHTTGAGVPINPQFTAKATELQTNARYILLIEKDATFIRLINDEFHLRQPCIMVTGRGYPDLGTRLFLRKLRDTFALPIFGLMDWDPSGVEILCTYAFGNNKRGYDTTLPLSTVRWLGIHAADLEQYAIPKDACIPLTEYDRKKCMTLLQCGQLQALPFWRIELEQMLQSGVKAEIQALCSRGLSFLAERFLPEKIQEGKWI